jgi:phosphatidylglycerol:prolipoprotein diacylglycerol transferase
LGEFLLLPLAALPFPDIDPILIRIGPLAVHWYGVAYIVGILFGWWYGKRLCDDSRLWPGGVAPVKAQDVDDFLVYAALGIVLGGRVGYILFYDLPKYLENPLDIFAVWQGGMSFHGGFAGCTLAMILFARSRGFSAWSLFDVIAAGTPIAIGLVRIANFINGELWGKLTNVPWAFEFPSGGPFTRHPSQLYEALLEGIVLFLLLRVLTHRFGKLGSPGFVSGAFVTGYAAARVFVEFFREPDAQLGYLLGGWLTMGMLLSVPMALAGIWAMATARRTAEPKAA